MKRCAAAFFDARQAGGHAHRRGKTKGERPSSEPSAWLRASSTAKQSKEASSKGRLTDLEGGAAGAPPPKNSSAVPAAVTLCLLLPSPSIAGRRLTKGSPPPGPSGFRPPFRLSGIAAADSTQAKDIDREARRCALRAEDASLLCFCFLPWIPQTRLQRSLHMQQRTWNLFRTRVSPLQKLQGICFIYVYLDRSAHHSLTSFRLQDTILKQSDTS